MLTYDQALANILDAIAPLLFCEVPPAGAGGRALQMDIVAALDLPPFDNSQMDGYAVIAEDTLQATIDAPVALAVAGEVPAGPIREDCTLRSGMCVRIFTGAPLPESADAVVLQEDAEVDDSGRVLIAAPVRSGDFVRRAGEDIRRGTLAVAAGTILRAYEISLLSALGHASVTLGATPRAGMVCTGNELVEPGAPRLQPGEIYNSNQAALEALVRSAGAIPAKAMIARDSEDDIARALSAVLAADPDLIIICGGVSVGKYDCVKPAIAALGGSLNFTRVAMRPGKPTIFGMLSGKPIFGLPGNPVSAMVTFELFARPAILRLAGYPLERCVRPWIDAILAEPIGHEPGRRSFARATLECVDATVRVYPAARQRSDQITGIAGANALMAIPEGVAMLPADSKVKVMLID